MSLSPSQQACLRGLYAVTPDDPLLPRMSALVREALAGGVKVVQYRNKVAPPPLFRAQAAELLRICRAAGALLIVNDNPEIAADIGADGVHVGREDGGVARAPSSARIASSACPATTSWALPNSRSPKVPTMWPLAPCSLPL